MNKKKTKKTKFSTIYKILFTCFAIILKICLYITKPLNSEKQACRIKFQFILHPAFIIADLPDLQTMLEFLFLSNNF